MRKILLAFGFCLVPLLGNNAAAQTTLTSQGVSGDMDVQNRCPVLSVGTQVSKDNVKILADAVVDNEEYTKYPLRFDFYVNRKLFAAQWRSKELPGPVGVDIGTDIATVPFNYVVVVQIVHPNHAYTTAIQGAVFANELSGAYDCTLTIDDADGSTAYTVKATEGSQTTNETLAFAFDAKSEDGTQTAKVAATVTISGEAATAEAKITRDDTSETVAMTGTVSKKDEKITSFSVETEDTSVSLECMASGTTPATPTPTPTPEETE